MKEATTTHPPRKFFIGGNWKLNGSMDFINKFSKEVLHPISKQMQLQFNPGSKALVELPVEIVVAPPSPYLECLGRKIDGTIIQVAAQNISDKLSGAYTGEVSVAMLKDLGIKWSIVGHSERRQYYGESDKIVAEKVKTALSFEPDYKFGVILCIGETLGQRQTSQTIQIIHQQLDAIKFAINNSEDWKRIVIAYEPVWAIGTGQVATPDQVQIVHSAIRSWLRSQYTHELAESVRIIYGGSVNENNCRELAGLADVDGFLVGGASLKPEFGSIISSVKEKSCL